MIRVHLRSHLLSFIGLTILLLVCPGHAQIKWPFKMAEREAGLAFSPGIYSSYASVFICMRQITPVLIYKEDEAELYTDLILESYKPTHLLAEVTVYPTASFSGWLKTKHFDFYSKFDLPYDLNFWSSVAGNYQEPWSLSLFTGQLVNFLTLTDGEELKVGASGAGGFVATTGWQEIFDGYILSARWWRCEWKIKGAGSDQTKAHSWDIKIGYRWYGLPQIANTFNLTFARQKTDKDCHSLNFRQNSCAEIELQIPPGETKKGFSRITCAYGKFWPFRKYLVGLKIGYSYEKRPQYRGLALGFTSVDRIMQSLIFQPMVEF